MMTFSELKAMAAQALQLSCEALCDLSDRVQQGDDSALQALYLARLPEFCSAYRFQTGPYADDETLLADCLQRYLAVLRQVDFRQASGDFNHLLNWHIRQARTAFIAAQFSPESENTRPAE